MEFFDFTGTNEEEKAQALDIITHESSGVEFCFLNYNNSFNTNHLRHHQNNEHSKSYLHANGDLPSQNENSSSLSMNNHHEQHHDDQEIVQDSQHVDNNFNNPLNEWETNESTPPPNSTVLLSNIGGGAQYLFPGATHPYFPGPPNHYTLLHTAIGPHQVTNMSNQSKQMCMPSVIPNIVSSSSMTNKNPSKNTTVNSSNCDIRNSMYMPPQYSDTSIMMDSNNRLKNSSAVSGDGGIISDSLVSNGSAMAAVTHHLGPHYSYAFQTPINALPFHHHHHGHFAQQIYYVPHEGFIQYAFPSTSAPPHISPISAAPHPASVMTSSSMDMTTTSNANQVMTSSSSAPTSAPSTTATLSNLSSMSASSSSITAAYHSSLQSSTSDTPVFETTNNENYIHQNELSTNNSPNSSTSDKKEIGSSQVPSQSKDINVVESNGDSTALINHDIDIITTKQASDVQEYLKFCLNISDNKTKQEKTAEDVTTSKNNKSETAQTNKIEEVNNNNSPTADQPNVIGNNNNKTLDTTQKPTTWASKLFPATISTSSSNNVNENNIHSISNKSSVNEDLKITPSENNIVNEVKTNLQNGEFPELNSNSMKNLVNSSNNNPMISNSNSSRRGRFMVNDEDMKKLTVISMKKDPIALKLAKRLRDSIHLKHSLPTIMPCGLINRGNWCYVNATLQALLACPPFYNLMREISETPGLFRQCTSTPIIDNFARYFSKFLPSDYKRQMKSACSPFLEELLNSDPFEPLFIYDTLKHIGMIKNDAQRGHQEDAEEFLSSVLNGIHEEMINLQKLLNETSNEKKISKTNGFSSGDEVSNEDPLMYEDNVNDSNDIWHEVGTSKHKSLPTRSAKIISTSITEIFGGSTLDIRTVNKDKDSCGNRQPFFTLQLDIKPSSIRSLDDAIRWQTKSETIHGYTCSKTKQVVDASSQMFLENLPPILIFHLKLFDYEIETGASKKLLKTIDFPENFEIPRECVTGKIDNRCRRYKLLAVVYHNGSEAINGHYLTDVYHLGLNQWLRCDDAAIKVISLSKVLPGSEREGNLVPYLLFYRRYDTLHSNHNSSNANMQQLNSGTNNGTKRSSTNNTEHGHNQISSHHEHNSDMLTSNKFSSISRQF